MHIDEYNRFKEAVVHWSENYWSIIVDNPEWYPRGESCSIEFDEYPEVFEAFLDLCRACPTVYYKLSLHQFIEKVVNFIIDIFYEWKAEDGEDFDADLAAWDVAENVEIFIDGEFDELKIRMV